MKLIVDIPLEVKAGASREKRSLRVYGKKFKPAALSRAGARSNPVGKKKSVAFTESGLRKSQRLLSELFAMADGEG
jgi:hypothetical protein